jgi:hypothetical protein
MLSPPLKVKKPSEVFYEQSSKLLEELKRFSVLRSDDGSGDRRVVDAVKRLDAMRKALSEEPSEGSIEGHIQYWAELCELSKRFDSFSSFDIKFVWFDAWQGAGLGSAKFKSSSCNLEIASVLFNGATLALLHGAQCQGKKTMQGYQDAKRSFLRAAGMYAAVSDCTKDIQQEVSTDMSNTALEMLQMLSLAHAQRMFFDAAISEGKETLLPRLAAATADYYFSVNELLHDKSLPLGKHLNKTNNHGKWAAESMVSSLYYRAAAQQYAAANFAKKFADEQNTDELNRLVASEILSLRKALEMLQQAERECVRKIKKIPDALRALVAEALLSVKRFGFITQFTCFTGQKHTN